MGFIRIDKNNTDVGFKNICDVDWKLYMDMSESTIDGPMDIIAGKQGYDKDGNLIMGELVPEGYTVEEKEVSISENGDYEIRPDEANFLTKVNLTVDVPEGTDTSDATATAGDILKGKTAYVNGEKITGTFECGEVDKDKMLKDWTSDANARPEDILKGKTAYVNGNKIVGTYVPQECPECPDFKTEEKEITIHSNGTFYVNKSLLMDGMTKVTVIVDIDTPTPPQPVVDFDTFIFTNGMNYTPLAGDWVYLRTDDTYVSMNVFELGDNIFWGHWNNQSNHAQLISNRDVLTFTPAWMERQYEQFGLTDFGDVHSYLVEIGTVDGSVGTQNMMLKDNATLVVYRKK